ATAVDYLFLNRDEALLYTDSRTLATAVDRCRRAPCTIVVKLGAAGSRAVGGNGEGFARATRVRAVDSTGAGDAFNAGFLVSRLRGGDLRTAREGGNRLGALSTRRAGGVAGLPGRSGAALA